MHARIHLRSCELLAGRNLTTPSSLVHDLLLVLLFTLERFLQDPRRFIGRHPPGLELAPAIGLVLCSDRPRMSAYPLSKEI